MGAAGFPVSPGFLKKVDEEEDDNGENGNAKGDTGGDQKGCGRNDCEIPDPQNEHEDDRNTQMEDDEVNYHSGIDFRMV